MVTVTTVTPFWPPGANPKIPNSHRPLSYESELGGRSWFTWKMTIDIVYACVCVLFICSALKQKQVWYILECHKKSVHCHTGLCSRGSTVSSGLVMTMASGRPNIQSTDTRQELAELVKRRAEIAVRTRLYRDFQFCHFPLCSFLFISHFLGLGLGFRDSVR